MNALAVLFAAATLAADHPHHASPQPAPPDAARQQRQYEAAVRRMQEQEQHRLQQARQQQERAIHEQLRSQLAAPHHGTTLPGATPGVAPGGYAGRPYALAHPHHGSGYGYGYGYGGYHRHHGYHQYRHHRSWPSAQDPELAALQHLKHALDAVPMGHSATAGHQSAIKSALMRVVETPRWPTEAAVDRLAGHVGHALAGRGAAAVDTSTMALMLRAGVNAPLLVDAERAEAVRDLEAAMRHGRVQPEHVASVVAALKDVEHQELARR